MAVCGVGDDGLFSTGILPDLHVAVFKGNGAPFGLLGVEGEQDGRHFLLGIFQQNAGAFVHTGGGVLHL